MKVTVPLCKQHIQRAFKRLWDMRKNLKIENPKVPKAWVEQGVKIVDPNKKPEKKLEPFVFHNWKFRLKPKGREHPNWHDKPAYLFNTTTRICGGGPQAQVIGKASARYHLPERIQALVGKEQIPNQDELVQNNILHALLWDAYMEKLPKEPDFSKLGVPSSKYYVPPTFGIPAARKTMLLLSNLVRLASTIEGKYPEMVNDRYLVRNAVLSCPFEKEGHLLQIHGTANTLITSKKPLMPFATPEEVADTVSEKLPNIHPLHWTIDFHKENIYDLKESWGLGNYELYPYPHTMYIGQNRWWYFEDQAKAMALLNCLSHCINLARRLYGPEVKNLPEPITTQHVMLHKQATTLHFTAFQLNTLDFDNPEGIKNLIWYDHSNPLFSEVTEGKVVDYNPETFQKFLAFYMNK